MPSRDWRSEAAYADLDTASLRGLAWEYLRRNPTYERDWRDAMRTPSVQSDATVATRWGLRFPERSGAEPCRRRCVLVPVGVYRHRRALGLAAVVLASIASCAAGCDIAAARR